MSSENSRGMIPDIFGRKMPLDILVAQDSYTKMTEVILKK